MNHASPLKPEPVAIRKPPHATLRFAIAGFSLTEVVIALGIISFALVALVGMLPVGLDTLRQAREESTAGRCLEQISDAIRGAVRVSPGVYRGYGAYADLEWTVGDDSSEWTFTDIGSGGIPVEQETDQKLTALIRLEPPPDFMTPGTAMISIAWPNTAEWDDDSDQWKNASGTLSTWVVFLPEQ